MARNSCLRGLRSRVLMSTGLVTLFCFGGVALAGDPGKDAKQEAKAHFSAAQSHYNLNEFEDALREFKESYRLFPDPVFLFNLGQCERQLGHDEEAIKFYRSYLREQPKAANRQDVLDKISELEASIRQKQADLKQPVPPEAGRPAEAALDPQPAAAPVPSAGPAAPANAAPAAAELPPNPAAQPLPAAPPVEPQAVGATPSRIDLTASPEPSDQTGATPIYKRWWVWTAAAVVAVGVGVGIYAATAGDGATVPSSGLGSRKVF